MMLRIKLPIILLCAIFAVFTLKAQQTTKHRVIVLTDIEADPDDTQSLVRLLLYSNEIDIHGLIATTSCWMQHELHPESIKKVIDEYEKVQPNLTLHKSDYPKASKLYEMIKKGQPSYGMNSVGDGKDSEGSEWIIKALEEKDDRPLWISTWGGANTLAQALFKLKKTKDEQILKHLLSKLRVYTISDQDDSGLWIRNNFPELFYIVSPGDNYGQATWTGINMVVEGIDNSSISNDWLANNIQQNHGPLGASYPDVAWGMEGDTPAFLSLIQNGLSNPNKPNWGGWGGRYELYLPDFSTLKEGSSIVEIGPETRSIWTNSIDTYTPYIDNPYGRTVVKGNQTFKSDKATIWRWRNDFQNDFAARMDWTIHDYENANHAPVPILSNSEILKVKSGEWISLDAVNSYDPDGDSFSFLWFHYQEASSGNNPLNLGAENTHKIAFKAPEVKQNEIIHIILKVTDRGTPKLSAYKRVIIEVTPH